MTLTNHLKDTDDQALLLRRAFLAVLPGTSGFKLTWAGERHAGGPGQQEDQDLHAPAPRPRRSGCTAARAPSTGSRFDLDDPGGAADPRPARRRLAGVVPGLGVRYRRTPGGSVSVVFPEGYDVEVEAGEIPAADDRRRGPDRLPDRRAGQAARLLRLPRRRPTGRLRGTTRRADGRRRARSRSTIRVVAGRPALGRAGRRAAAHRLPALGERDRARLAARRRRSSSRRRSAARPAAMPGCSTRPTGRSRSPTTPTTSWSSTRPPTAGSTARCWPTAGRTRRSPRTTRPRPPRELELEVRDDELTDELLAGARIPLNAWGPVGAEDPASEDYAYAARWSSPGAIAERAGDDGLRRGLGGRGRRRPGLPAAVRGRRTPPEAVDGTARLARPARPARGRAPTRPTTTCGAPGSPARPTCPCSMPGPLPGTS